MMSGDRRNENAPDRDVLFGITAWQLGLVDRDALMAAMYEWMTDRRRPLPDVLEAAGKLQAEDRRRVEQFVAQRTDSHGGDAARTLVELESVAELSEQLREIVRRGNPTQDLAATDPKAPTLAHSVDRHAPILGREVYRMAPTVTPPAGRVAGG
jgi:hypothetical protein